MKTGESALHVVFEPVVGDFLPQSRPADAENLAGFAVITAGVATYESTLELIGDLEMCMRELYPAEASS